MNREEFHKKIGVNIRKLRKKAGLSISKAAKPTAVPPKDGSFSKWAIP
jgi:hypothetical protein